MQANPSSLLALALLLTVLIVVAAIADWRESRAERAEEELDKAERELRLRIVTLASQLSAEAHDARKALIRESFLSAQRDDPPGR